MAREEGCRRTLWSSSYARTPPPQEREAIARTLLAGGHALPEQPEASDGAQFSLDAGSLSEETRRELSALSGVERLVETTYRLAEPHPPIRPTTIQVGSPTIGGGSGRHRRAVLGRGQAQILEARARPRRRARDCCAAAPSSRAPPPTASRDSACRD